MLRIRSLTGPARLALFSCVLLAAASPASADIDTTTSWDGIEYTDPFGIGTGTPTYGQTITVPARVSPLNSFSFQIGGCSTSIIVRGEVYAWNGSTTTGPALFESAPVTISTGSFRAVTFNTGGLSLPAGQYILFVTTSRDAGQVGNTACRFGFGLASAYSGGGYAFTNAGASNWSAGPWSTFLGDLAFRVNGLNPLPPAQTPLPPSAWLALTGLAGAGVAELRRRRRSRRSDSESHR